jgi:hypothetical protein
MNSLSFKRQFAEKPDLCSFCHYSLLHTSNEHEYSVSLHTPDETALSHEPKHPTDAVGYDITKPFSVTEE